MEIVGGEATMYRLLAYVALTLNFAWRTYALPPLVTSRHQKHLDPGADTQLSP